MTTRQWEYFSINISPEDDVPEFERTLDELGLHGWELVGVIPGSGVKFLVFKRPRERD